MHRRERTMTMSFLDSMTDILKAATSGNAKEPDVHAAYDQVAQPAPHGELSDALTHVFNSDQTPPFEQMVAGMFSQSSPDQKAGVINQILGSLGPGTLAQILGGTGGLGSLGGLLSGGSVTPEQAQQVSPQSVEVLAQKAAGADPSIVNRVSDFYAHHSTLIKALGAGALALLMSRMSQNRR
jgi:hypothetical protein